MEKYFSYERRMLENRMEVYHIKTNSELFSLNLGVKIGSKYESESEKGLTHFVEHMIFKGTEKRDNIKINEDIEELAGYSNAYTSYSDTVFKFMALNEEFENAVEILSDLIRNPVFPEEEFKKEKDVILSEIKSDLDNIEDYSYFRIEKEAFEKSFLAWDIAGDMDDVLRYSRDDIERYYRKYYNPDNSVIVIASSFSSDYVFSLIEKYFRDWEYRETHHPEVITEKNREKEYIIEKPDFEQSNILYLFTFGGLTRREELALSVLSYSLGENSNSHLFKRLREEKGMTYEVYSDFDVSKDVKTLYIYTALSKENLTHAKEIIEKTLSEVKEGKLVNEKSVRLMKKILKTSIASALLDPQHISDYVMGQIMEDRDVYEFEDNLRTIESLKLDEIIEVGRKVFVNPTVQIIEGGEKNG